MQWVHITDTCLDGRDKFHRGERRYLPSDQAARLIAAGWASLFYQASEPPAPRADVAEVTLNIQNGSIDLSSVLERFASRGVTHG